MMLHRKNPILKAAIVALVMTACSPSTSVETETAPLKTKTKTNAEFMLDSIESGAAGIILHLRPKVKKSCSYMYVEVSENLDGMWYPRFISSPGKKQHETYGETFIENMPVFISLTSENLHGITAIGCSRPQDGVKVVNTVLTTFTPKLGQVTYIGEMGPWDTHQRYQNLLPSDKFDTMSNRIVKIIPGASEYLTKDIMEPFVLELSPEQKAALKAEEIQNAKTLLCDGLAAEHNRILKDETTSARENFIRKKHLRDMIYGCRQIKEKNMASLSLMEEWVSIRAAVMEADVLYALSSGFLKSADSLNAAQEAAKDFERRHNLRLIE